MVINEVFQNPTVKKIIFQIRFPNLFYIESKIGEFQIKIMEKFPDSALKVRRQVLFADIGPDSEMKELPDNEGDKTKKIWQFTSPEKYQLNITSNSLDISTEHHKSYRLDDENKFRDVIEFALQNFFETVRIPVITRLGLRYIDECPVLNKDNESFKSYYNSTFPLDRFKIEDSEAMEYYVVVQRGDYYLKYIESFQKIESEFKLILDFDGHARDIKPDDCMKITDDLHDLLSDEYQITLKEPVFEYMRNVGD